MNLILKNLREDTGMSKADIARNLNLPYTTYDGYERGDRELSSKMLVTLSNYYKVSVDYLLGNEKREIQNFIVNIKEQKHIQKYRKLDEHGKLLVDTVLQLEYNKHNNDYLSKPDGVINNNLIKLKVYEQRASAGVGKSLLESYPFEIKEYEENNITKQADHVILINGDSMSPTLEDGQEVFVKECITLDSNNVGIFIYEDEVFCKRLILDRKNKKIILRSDNSQYADKVINEDEQEYLRVIGKVLL